MFQRRKDKIEVDIITPILRKVGNLIGGVVLFVVAVIAFICWIIYQIVMAIVHAVLWFWWVYLFPDFQYRIYESTWSMTLWLISFICVSLGLLCISVYHLHDYKSLVTRDPWILLLGLAVIILAPCIALFGVMGGVWVLYFLFLMLFGWGFVATLVHLGLDWKISRCLEDEYTQTQCDAIYVAGFAVLYFLILVPICGHLVDPGYFHGDGLWAAIVGLFS